jgi:hypothetical protein
MRPDLEVVIHHLIRLHIYNDLEVLMSERAIRKRKAIAESYMFVTSLGKWYEPSIWSMV